MTTIKSTERFSNRVENYLKYRPSYPPAIISFLENACHLTKTNTIADMGSGTGLLTELFLKAGYAVYGVEPNKEMRQAGEAYLKEYPNFYSIEATAENTDLPNSSVQLIVAGTAFHWFNPEKTKLEFQRILQTNGFVALLWNVRNLAFPLMQEYEALILKYGTDYQESGAMQFNHSVGEDFFAPHVMHTASFVNQQFFDRESFQGRLLSASYALQPNDTGYETMIDALNQIFDRHEQRGKICFEYETKIYYGQLAK